MIRISRRKQAGTRRNKRHKSVQTEQQRIEQYRGSHRIGHRRRTRLNFGHGGHSLDCLDRAKYCNCNPFEHRSKPNHATRALDIRETFGGVSVG